MARVEMIKTRKAWQDAVAVDDIDLTIEDGEFIAILGPSGCGKSTTLFMLAGIYLPTTGDIRFDGQSVNEVEPRDRNVGIVFQSYALYPNMTVLANILFPLRFKAIGKAAAEEKARNVARLVEIENLLDRKPGQLSGGQQQRVALARALVKEPHLLLLDEPLSNLDATLRLTMRTEIRRIQRELSVTTVLVTHDQIEATTMADRIICMNAGGIEQIGTPDALYRRPDTLFVASFIGSPPMNMIEGHITDGAFTVNDFHLPLSGSPKDEPAIFGLRPEALKVASTGMAVTVESIEPMGRETLYALQTPLGILRLLDNASVARFTRGQELNVQFDREDTLFFSAGTQKRLNCSVAETVSVPA